MWYIIQVYEPAFTLAHLRPYQIVHDVQLTIGVRTKRQPILISHKYQPDTIFCVKHCVFIYNLNYSSSILIELSCREKPVV